MTIPLAGSAVVMTVLTRAGRLRRCTRHTHAFDTVMHGGEPHVALKPLVLITGCGPRANCGHNDHGCRTHPYVALKPIVEGMGLDWNGQYQRAMRDSVLSDGMCVTHMPSRGGQQETVCLPLKMLNGFLFGIDENRVRPELKDGIIAYKRECYDALSRYWLHGAAVRPVETDHATSLASKGGAQY